MDDAPFPHAVSTNWAELGDDVVGKMIHQMQAPRLSPVVPAASLLSSEDILNMIRDHNESQAEEIDFVTQQYGSTHHVQVKLDRFQRVMFRVVLMIELSRSRSIVRFSVTFLLPPLYPAVGHPLDVRIGAFPSTRDFAASLTKHLNDVARELSSNEMPAISAVISECEERVATAPRAQLASNFGCCVPCSIAKLKRGEQKHPQPLEKAGDRWRCMSCGDENAILIPSIFFVDEERVDDFPCSYCFCGDTCMFRFPGCGCVACFDCVVNLADIAVGEKNLVKREVKPLRPAENTPMAILSQPVGLACPNHTDNRSAVLYDHGFFKLLPPRTYNRYNFFAMELTLAKKKGILYCPIPTCCGYFFLSDQIGSIVGCPFCDKFFCVECQQAIDEKGNCECESTKDVTLDVIDDTELYRSFALGPLFALAQESRLDAKANYERALTPQERPVTVRITNRNRQLTLDLPSNDLRWYVRLANFVSLSDLCPYAQYYRERTEGVSAVFFHGMLLDANRTLESQGVFHGAILFVVEVYLMAERYRQDLVAELRRCRRSAGRPHEFLVETKKCPVCAKPTVHYLGHGCHIMYGCHRGLPEWCYACGRATTHHGCDHGCPMFCQYQMVMEKGVLRAITTGCSCPLCPDCKPLRPCVNCTLCPMCTMDGMTKLI